MVIFLLSDEHIALFLSSLATQTGIDKQWAVEVLLEVYYFLRIGQMMAMLHPDNPVSCASPISVSVRRGVVPFVATQSESVNKNSGFTALS